LQRSRLLTAAVGLLAEHGYDSFSVAALCERTGVSRRTFYEVFEHREACFAALLHEAEGRFSSLIVDISEQRSWNERVRMGLWALLCLADSDPALAKACLIESQRAAGSIQIERERMVSRLVEVIDEGRLQSTHASAASELTAEALIGAVSAVIAARLTAPRSNRHASSSKGHASINEGRASINEGRASINEGRASINEGHASINEGHASINEGHASISGGVGLRGLLGELMAMVVLPYQGPAAARREIKRALPADVIEVAEKEFAVDAPDPLAGRPARLTYRTARVLQAVAALCADGEGVSNRQVAEHAAISDPGQASKLLARLQAHDLLENVAKGNLERGEANQWRLTSAGRRLVRSIGAQTGEGQMRGRSAA
jgi:AcrR family transcriptional regulator